MASNDDSVLTLSEVMEEHPHLNSFGIGAFAPSTKTQDEREAEVAEGRAELLRREPFVMQLVAWLQANVSPIRTPTHGSYNLKHIAEKAIGGYVGNGELIAAALVAGYPHKYAVPNVIFGMSSRDVKKLRQPQ